MIKTFNPAWCVDDKRQRSFILARLAEVKLVVIEQGVYKL